MIPHKNMNPSTSADKNSEGQRLRQVQILPASQRCGDVNWGEEGRLTFAAKVLANRIRISHRQPGRDKGRHRRREQIQNSFGPTEI